MKVRADIFRMFSPNTLLPNKTRKSFHVKIHSMSRQIEHQPMSAETHALVADVAEKMVSRQNVRPENLGKARARTLVQIDLLRRILPEELFYNILTSLWRHYYDGDQSSNNYSLFAAGELLSELKNRHTFTSPTEDYPGLKTDVPKGEWTTLQTLMTENGIQGEVIFSQALSSMSPAYLISRAIETGDLPVSGHVVAVDICGAPGNKTFNLLNLSTYSNIDSLTLVVNDLRPARIERVNQRLREMGFREDGSDQLGSIFTPITGQFSNRHIKVITTSSDAQDPSHLSQVVRARGGKDKADIVIADVHCKGGGESFLRPDKTPARNLVAAPDHTSLQVRLLSSGLQLVAPEGLVSYSTCSHDPHENEAVLAYLHNDVSFVEPAVDFDETHFFGPISEYDGTTYPQEVAGVRMYPHTMDVGFFAALVRPKV